jgi:hypothetical protein
MNYFANIMKNNQLVHFRMLISSSFLLISFFGRPKTEVAAVQTLKCIPVQTGNFYFSHKALSNTKN